MEEEKDNPKLWTANADNYLRTLVSLHGTSNWDTILSNLRLAFPSLEKTAQECKQRWHDILEVSDSKEPWTEKEELEMLKAHKKYQNKWSEMAQALNGRSNNSIKNRFYSIFRKVKNKILRKDYTLDTKIEIGRAHV